MQENGLAGLAFTYMYNLSSRFCSYGGFYNKPLTEGMQYDIWYGAGNIVDGLARFNYTIMDRPVLGM